jgi:hypothetical protein
VLGAGIYGLAGRRGRVVAAGVAEGD